MNLNLQIAALNLRRQALEATGWRCYPRGSEVETDLGDATMTQDGYRKPGTNRVIRLEDAPAVESDPGVSEVWFLEWCEKNGYQWNISTCDPHDEFKARHFVVWIFNPTTDMDFETEGATCSEARAKAVIAAMSGKGE